MANPYDYQMNHLSSPQTSHSTASMQLLQLPSSIDLPALSTSSTHLPSLHSHPLLPLVSRFVLLSSPPRPPSSSAFPSAFSTPLRTDFP
ncbi:hypothetical protein LINPERHAP1_LOCUS24306 [Linum perenne]